MGLRKADKQEVVYVDVTGDSGTYTVNKTYNEISNLFAMGCLVLLKWSGNIYSPITDPSRGNTSYFTFVRHGNGSYGMFFINVDNTVERDAYHDYIEVLRIKNPDGSYSYTCDETFAYVRDAALYRNTKVLLKTSENNTKILVFSRVGVDEVWASCVYSYSEQGTTYAKIEDVRFKADGSITRELRQVALT